MNYQALAKDFKDILKDYKRVSILMHKRPDGDTISSSLALFNSLNSMGYRCEVVCSDRDLPFKYRFLKGFSKIKDRLFYDDSLIITLDCSEFRRTGFEIEDFKDRVIINIDHHKSNEFFGKLNIVEICASTTAVLYKLLKEGFFIDKEIATALYAGLISDSINFTTSLVKKESFIIAKELIDFEIDINYIANMVNRQNSLANLRLKAVAINNLDLKFNAKVALSYITQKQMKECGAKGSDLDGVIDEFISLVNVEIAILLVEMDGFIKGSIRSKNVDISIMAAFFGGGGHKGAGGFEVKDVTISKLIEEIYNYIKDNYTWQEEE